VIAKAFAPLSFREKETVPSFLSLALLLTFSARANGQASVALPDAPSAQPQQTQASEHIPLEDQPHPVVTVFGLPKSMASDAVHIFTSPAYIRTRDLAWLLPLAGASGAAFATDTHTMREVVSRNTSLNDTAVNVSDALLATAIATPVSMYAWGKFKGDERARETGILGSQAMVEAYAVGELVKVITFRERPNLNNARGDFFSSDSKLSSSFVSGHSVIAWSSAAVIAGEYHNPWAQLGVYTAATGVSLTRVMGQQHFPSDVLIGSSVGWLIGHYVYRAHHHVPRKIK